MKIYHQRILLIALPLSCCLVGCMPIGPRVYYNIRLSEVERPATARERYGEQVITTKTGTGDTLRYWFEDEVVSILWIPTNVRVHFRINNKTSHSIKIIWDEAAFVTPTGQSRRVVHSGVKYSDRNNPQPPSVVVQGGTLDDFVLSSDQCYYVSGKYGGWDEAPFLPDSPDAATANSLRGKTFKILLPFQIEGVTNEYLFTFSIDDVIFPTPQETTRW